MCTAWEGVWKFTFQGRQRQQEARLGRLEKGSRNKWNQAKWVYQTIAKSRRYWTEERIKRFALTKKWDKSNDWRKIQNIGKHKMLHGWSNCSYWDIWVRKAGNY